MTTAVQGSAPRREEGDDRPLRRGEWRTLAILGLPTFAAALAITAVTTYLPVVASDRRRPRAAPELAGLRSHVGCLPRRDPRRHPADAGAARSS